MRCKRKNAIALGLMICLPAIAVVRGQSPSNASSSANAISAGERQALVALYEATDGSHWKNNRCWMGPPGTECDWYEVSCGPRTGGPPTVIGLELSANHLHGRIPEAIGQLNNLEWLSLYGNELSGRIPEPLIRRWLAGPLWISAESPLLTDVTEIDFEAAASALLCEKHRVIFRSDDTAVLYTVRCRNASPKDRTTFCEVKTAKIGQGAFARLAHLLEKNGYFALQPEYWRNITDSSFLSTRVTRNGKEYAVVDYAGAGPFELWTIHLAIEGVTASIEWDAASTLPKCPSWEKPPASLPH